MPEPYHTNTKATMTTKAPARNTAARNFMLAILALCLIAPLQLSGQTCSGGNCTAASLSTIDVQNCINSTTIGNVCTLPSGTATWTSGVTVNKAIKIQGAGAGRIVAYAFTASPLSLGTGSKSLTLTGTTANTGTTPPATAAFTTLGFANGQVLRLSELGFRANFMQGTVTSWNSSTGALTLNVTSSGGTCGTSDPNMPSNCKRWLVSTIPSTVLVHNVPGTMWNLTESTAGSMYISGIKFATGSGTGPTIYFNRTSGGQAIVLHDDWIENINAIIPVDINTNRGLIYNTSIDNSPFSVIEDIRIKDANDTSMPTSWTTVSTYGANDTAATAFCPTCLTGQNNFYVENTDFHAGENVLDWDDNARAVARYNFFDNAGMGTHGADTSEVGVRHHELYNNVGAFVGYNDGTTANMNWWVFNRGGTMAVHDNVFPALTSTDYGTKSDVTIPVENLDRIGGQHPCWGQGTTGGANYYAPRQNGFGRVTGTGTTSGSQSSCPSPTNCSANHFSGSTDAYTYVGDSEPIYIWNNRRTTGGGTTNLTISLGTPIGQCTSPDSASNYEVAGRDYINTGTAKPSYTPYTYPHPLAAFSGHSYSTTFPATENPISESGVWINGLATGLDWDNVQTTTNKAFGTGVNPGPPYNDSTAVLSGAWNANQEASGTLYLNNSGDSSIAQEEVEIRLNSTMTAHSSTGYECDLSAYSGGYAAIVRWNGPVNNFTQLAFTPSVTTPISTGSTFKCTKIGSTITMYIGSTAILSATDSTYSNGSPGIGFWLNGGTTALLPHFGFSSFSADDTPETQTVATPTFSPTPGGYGSAQTVTLATTTSGATLCYTTDGSSPTTNGSGTCVHGSIYSVPFTVSSSTIVKAIGTLSGYTDSSISTGTYTINGSAAFPTFSPVAGTYGAAQNVAITSATTGSTICYTTDGSTPTADGAGTCTHGTTYTSLVTVSSSETLKAIASKPGWNDSAVASAAYVINGAAATPTFSPAAGSYGPSQSVTISSSTTAATICYTTNGSTPTSSSPGTCAAGSTQYVSPVTVASSLTLKAIATKSGYSDSTVGSAAYIINGPVADVTFSPVGGSYGPAQSVTLSTVTASAAICYTEDGSTPTASGGTCTHGITYSTAITVSSSETIYAIGTKSGYSESGVTGASYTINGTLAAPTFAPAAGSYGGTQTVTLSASGGGVTIINQMTETSNLNDTAGHAVHRNVYTNCAEGYSGGSLQPTGVPVGNLYCTAADKTAALANGGPNLGVVSATTTNSGITGIENGMDAGGSDSAPTVTATYAGTTGTGCGVGATFTSNLFSGLTLPGEVASSRAVFGLTTASSAGNTSMLAVSKYNTNGDSGNNLERIDCASPNTTSAGGQHYEWDSNYNTSGGSYMGFGMDYNFATSKLRACFQGCSGWTDIELVPIGGGTTLTTYSWPANDYLFSERHDYWDAGCSYSSSSNCAYYGEICLQLWSAGSPVNSLTCYNIRNASTHGVISAKPVNKTSWTKPQYGVQHQWDINSTSKTLTANVAFDSLVAFQNSVTPTICYTTDGTTPTADGAGNCTHGTTYSAPISVAVTTTIKAVASEAGFTDSSVASATYTINGAVATPTFSPTAGTYATTQSVTISTVTGGATLCYTTDGSTPTTDGAGTCTHGTTYTVPISVAVSQTIQAIGTESGFTDSALASASYTITGASAPIVSGSVTISGTAGIQ